MPKKQKIYKKQERNCSNCINSKSFDCPHVFWIDGLSSETHYCNIANATNIQMGLLRLLITKSKQIFDSYLLRVHLEKK